LGRGAVAVTITLPALLAVATLGRLCLTDGRLAGRLLAATLAPSLVFLLLRRGALASALACRGRSATLVAAVIVLLLVALGRLGVA
jgi:hypothetical protein